MTKETLTLTFVIESEERKIKVCIYLLASVCSDQIHPTAHLWFCSAHHIHLQHPNSQINSSQDTAVAQIHVLREFHKLWLWVGVRYGGVINHSTMQWCGCCNWKHQIKFKSFINEMWECHSSGGADSWHTWQHVHMVVLFELMRKQDLETWQAKERCQVL